MWYFEQYRASVAVFVSIKEDSHIQYLLPPGTPNESPLKTLSSCIADTIFIHTGISLTRLQLSKDIIHDRLTSINGTCIELTWFAQRSGAGLARSHTTEPGTARIISKFARKVIATSNLRICVVFTCSVLWPSSVGTINGSHPAVLKPNTGQLDRSTNGNPNRKHRTLVTCTGYIY